MIKRAVALNALLIVVCGFLLYSGLTAEIEDETTPWLLRNEE
jgi:hypothetical protein